jgi:predicted GNAT family N-acyltransferase
MEIRWLNGSENLSDAFEIRNHVFIQEQKVPEELELDEFDKVSEHIVLYYNKKPVATGRIIIQDDKYFLGRIAVIKKYRSKGFGKVVVQEMINKLFNDGVNEVFIHAQAYVKEFYEKLGFKTYGDRFNEAGIEHVHMVINNIKV